MKFYVQENAMCDMFASCPNGDVLYLTSGGEWEINKIYTDEELTNDPEFRRIGLHALKDLGIPIPKRGLRKLDWGCDDSDTYSTYVFVQGDLENLTLLILYRDLSGMWHLNYSNKDPSERISSSPLRHTLVEKAQSLHEEHLYAEFFE